MVITNCATTGLEPYVPSAAAPWDRARAQHLLRRISFGGRPAEIERALADGPAATVDRLLSDASTRPDHDAPEWARWDYDTFMANNRDVFGTYVEWNQVFMQDALDHGVREKLVLFWMNHFVAKYESYSCPSYYYQWMKVCTDHAFGEFRVFVRDITKTPAMLFFLNGFENTRDNPNENYARELFELFTMGENNGYTQEDIVEASRALTGWNGWTTYCGGVNWAPWGFDSGNKTVFGRTAPFNYGSLINMMFEERATEISVFICGKLYQYYVNPTIDEAIVDGLAATFRDNDFQILAVLRQLFASAHFFDAAHYGAQIKAPTEVLINFLREGDFEVFPEWKDWGFWSMANMGQYLGEPPDVSGWKGNRSWIDSNRLTLRWEAMDGFTWGVHNQNAETFPAFARALTDDSNQVDEVARAIVDYFIPRGLNTPEAYDLATDVLKWDVPANYYVDGTWSLYYPSVSWQITLLLRHLSRLPEFQLV